MRRRGNTTPGREATGGLPPVSRGDGRTVSMAPLASGVVSLMLTISPSSFKGATPLRESVDEDHMSPPSAERQFKVYPPEPIDGPLVPVSIHEAAMAVESPKACFDNSALRGLFVLIGPILGLNSFLRRILSPRQILCRDERTAQALATEGDVKIFYGCSFFPPNVSDRTMLTADQAASVR